MSKELEAQCAAMRQAIQLARQKVAPGGSPKCICSELWIDLGEAHSSDAGKALLEEIKELKAEASDQLARAEGFRNGCYELSAKLAEAEKERERLKALNDKYFLRLHDYEDGWADMKNSLAMAERVIGSARKVAAAPKDKLSKRIVDLLESLYAYDAKKVIK